jgi:hypothetical protein
MSRRIIMSNSLLQSYLEYVTHMNNLAYDVSMNYVKTTQEFVTQAVKQNPYKDAFGIMDTFVKSDTKSKMK